MMDESIESVSQWAEETFGPTTPGASLQRSITEIDELVDLYERGTDMEMLVEEAADVCITLYRFISLVDKEAINKKMAINRARKWVVNSDGTGQHIKEGGDPMTGKKKAGKKKY